MSNRSDKPYTGDGEKRNQKWIEETHEALDRYEAFFSQDEKVICINSSETNIAMFSTETNLRFLREPDK